jgi:hypothetical protein
VRLVSRVAIVVGLAFLGVAAAVLLWPLHAEGVSGRAIAPHYLDVRIPVTTPIGTDVTTAYLRDAGYQLPQDLVWHRRHVAELLAASGVLAFGLGATASRRRRRIAPG